MEEQPYREAALPGCGEGGLGGAGCASGIGPVSRLFSEHDGNQDQEKDQGDEEASCL